MQHIIARAYARPPPEPKMPPGLVQIMEGLTRDVLRHDPTNIYEFCADHMEKLLKIRDIQISAENKKTYTLEEKIKRAQEKVRERAKKHWLAVDKLLNDTVMCPDELDLKNSIGDIIRKDKEIDSRDVDGEESDLSLVETKHDTNVEEVMDNKEFNENATIEYVNGTSDKYSEEGNLQVAIEINVKHNSNGIHNASAIDNISIRNSTINANDIADQSYEIIDNSDTINKGDFEIQPDDLPGIQKNGMYDENAIQLDGVVKCPNNNVELNSKYDLKDSETVSVSESLQKSDSEFPTDGNENNALFCKISEETCSTKVEDIDKNEYINSTNSLNGLFFQNNDVKPFEAKVDDNHCAFGKIRETEDEYDSNVATNNLLTVFHNNMHGEDLDSKAEDRPSPTEYIDTNHTETMEQKIESIANANITTVEFQQEIVTINNENKDNFDNKNIVSIDPSSDNQDSKYQNENGFCVLASSQSELNTEENGKLSPKIDVVFDSHAQELQKDFEEDNIAIAEKQIDHVLNPQENDYINVDSSVDINRDTILSDIVNVNEKLNLNVLSTVTNAGGKQNENSQDYEEVINELSNQSEIMDASLDTKIDLSENKADVSGELEKEQISVKEDDSIHRSVNDKLGDTSHVVRKRSVNSEETANVEKSEARLIRDDKSTEVQPNAAINNGFVNDIKLNSENNADNASSSDNVNSDSVSQTNKNLSQETSVMDLETAAVTIQKVFRSFLFKSRTSTLDDINDGDSLDITEYVPNDNNSSETESDQKSDDDFIIRNLNTDRPRISRMETVLQTVNEEKSLSVSTDDSSLSSAATTIQAHVRGFLTRNKLNSYKTSSTGSMLNSVDPPEDSPDGDVNESQKSKTILNIHIIPEGSDFISKDESISASIDLPMDASPPSSKLHPLGYDKSERRKQLKREDAIQSVSPPSNNSGKLSEEEPGKSIIINQIDVSENFNNETPNGGVLDVRTPDLNSCDTTPTKSTTAETVIERIDYQDNLDNEDSNVDPEMKPKLTRTSSDEMDVVTPFTPRNGESSMLVHSGEFHDSVVPTRVVRSDSSVVREFKNVLVYFLLWSN